MPSWRSPGRIRVWTNVPNSSSLSHTSVMRSTPSPNEATWKRIPAGTSRSQPTSSRSASYWSGVRPSHFCMMTVAMMVPPCGGCGGCCGEKGSEGQRVAEHAAARPAAGERADVLDGVDVDVFAVVAVAEGPARRAVEHEVERLTVDRGPFGDDVGDQAAVMACREVHRPAGRTTDVDAVTPDVAGKSHVEQVLKRLPANRRAERERQVPHRGRCPPPAPDRLRAYLLELAGQLRVGEAGALADLQLVQAVYPVMRIDLLVQRQPPAQLVRELPHRGLRVSRSEHCRAILRTSHALQSVGSVHSSGVSTAASSAKRRNSSSARRRASGRSMRSGFICSSPCKGVVDQEVDQMVEMAEPAVAARIVAELSLAETGGHGDDAVDVALPGHPRGPHQRDRAAQYLLGQRVRFRRGREAGDGPLEQQLVAGGVLTPERREGGQELLESITGLLGERHSVQALYKPPVAVGEHRVVQGVLRVEVLIQRRLADSDLPRQGVQRHPGDPVFPG